MSTRQELEQAIRTLETQRAELGDSVVDAAIVPLREKLAGMDTVEPASGERRVVTILFCDVVGSTALAETMDPEAWTEIMNAAFERLVKPIDAYDGMVNRLLGDAVLAFFGAPTAHEDDPRRAVLTALEMLDNIRPFRDKLKSEKGLDFNIRIGINTGLAVVGEVGSTLHGEYSAMGDAVNVAARMEQTAAAGTIQIAQDTYNLIAPLFEFKELGGISVKGKSDPVLAFRVLGRKAEPGRLRGLTGHGISSPLVGRDEEFATARSALTRLQKGEGGILAIIGEAGIGKSRLLAELRKSIDVSRQDNVINSSELIVHYSQLAWLEGHTLSYGQSISYWPFQEILRTYAGIEEDDAEAEAWHKLEERIQALMAEETAEVLPYLASLLAIEVGEEYAERVKYLDSEGLGRQIYRASRLFFRRLAQRQPLTLIFDDVHWMDASSAALLEHLLPLTKQTPLLVCALSRTDPDSPATRLQEVASGDYSDRYMELALAPLSVSHSESLVHNLLEIDGLPGHTRRMMVDRADGNPFYLEEIVRNLIEAGALAQDASTGRWRATRRIEGVSVPDTIQGLLLARIDRLDDRLKRVVRRAAVIGRSFLYRILSAVVEDDGDLEQELGELERVELIREKQQIPELEYIFKHALAQEAAYDSILLQERRRLHARVGAEIESLFSDRLDEFYSLLAHHYSAAEEWDKAQYYLFKAGDQAGNMAADAEALAYYRQAMEAYARVRGDDWGPLDRASLERKIGEALYRMGQHEQARPYLERSLALLGAELPASRWGTRLAILGALFTQAGHRLLPRLFVRPMDGVPDPVAEEIFLASQALGWVEILANTERYLLLAVRALNSSERGGFAYGSAHLAATMGLAADLVGQPALAESYFRRSALYAEQIDPYRPVYQLEASLATHYNLLANTDKMREHGLRGADLARDAGDLRAWGLSYVTVAYSYWGQGRYQEGIEVSRELISVAEESSDRQVVCWALLAYGVCQRRLGLVNESIISYREALELAEDLPDLAVIAGAAGWMGRSYLAQGELAQALEVMEAAQVVFSVTGGDLGYAYLGNGLAEAYLEKAEAAQGEDRQLWMKKAGIESRKTLKAANRTASEMVPDAQLVQGRYQWLSGKPAEAQKTWQRALAKAEELGEPYLQGVIHLEIGRRLGDREHLQRAESILNEIGAEFDLKTAREALDSENLQ